MALLNIGDDPWLLEQESCEKLHCNLMEQLTLRQREPRTTEKYAQLSATIRMRLKQYNNEVNQLKLKVLQAARANTITPEEMERRTRQADLLQSKGMQMQKMFEEHNLNTNRDRARLMGMAGVSGWGSSDDELAGKDTNETVDELKNQQKRMFDVQERGLENLSKSIARQKNIAQTIGTEVELHNEILDDLGNHIDRTDNRVRTETQTIGTIDRTDKTCIYWVIIVLLFISIVTVALI